MTPPLPAAPARLAPLVLAAALSGCVQIEGPPPLGAPSRPSTRAPSAPGPCVSPPFTAPKAVLDDTSFNGGTVGVQIEIEPAGHVTAVTVIRSSGSAALDAAVVSHLRQVTCTFNPPIPQKVVTRQEITFRR